MKLTHRLCFLLALFSIDNLVLVSSAANTDANDASCDADKVDDGPRVLRKGVLEVLDDNIFHPMDGKDESSAPHLADIPGGESVTLQYVKSFLSDDDIAQAIAFCDGRNGWTASRQNYDGDGSAVGVSRTSNSCPLIWPLLYLPKLDALKESGRLTKALEDEIQFSWKLIQRISDFLDVDAGRIEPLQLIRYNPGQFYRQHHDHGSYYGASTEQRPITFLLFLSTMPVSDGGGHTKFEQLDIAVVPRAGDGIIWSNVDDEGKVLMDAVHEAVPPKQSGSIKKYAMNVWIAQAPIMKNIDTSQYRTK